MKKLFKLDYFLCFVILVNTSSLGFAVFNFYELRDHGNFSAICGWFCCLIWILNWYIQKKHIDFLRKALNETQDNFILSLKKDIERLKSSKENLDIIKSNLENTKDN